MKRKSPKTLLWDQKVEIWKRDKLHWANSRRVMELEYGVCKGTIKNAIDEVNQEHSYFKTLETPNVGL